jgi:hypothetical protein
MREKIKILDLCERFADKKSIVVQEIGEGAEFELQILRNKDGFLAIYHNTNGYEERWLKDSLPMNVETFLIDWFDEVSELKCECGAESIGVNNHSSWCGKASAA